MDIQKEIGDIEAALAGRGINLDDLLKLAEVTRSTWNRWKADTMSPTIKRWNAVTAAFDALMREAA